MQNFRELKVWQRSHQLVLELYRVTSNFPKSEVYGLTSQLRRAAASVPMNIVEGCGRGSNAELGRFLWIAMGSAAEVEYQCLLAHDLKFMTEVEFAKMSSEIVEIRRMLNALIHKVAQPKN